MIKSYYLEKLERFKAPFKIEITNQEQYSGRFKKDISILNLTVNNFISIDRT